MTEIENLNKNIEENRGSEERSSNTRFGDRPRENRRFGDRSNERSNKFGDKKFFSRGDIRDIKFDKSATTGSRDFKPRDNFNKEIKDLLTSFNLKLDAITKHLNISIDLELPVENITTD